MRVCMAAALLLSLVSAADAMDDRKIDRMSVETMDTFKPEALAWQDERLLPKGAKSALLVGDPSKAGVFIAYLKFPPNYVIPPHTHPFAEVVTVLSGTAGNGMGEKFDAEKGELLKAGSSFSLPAGHAHYLWTTDEEVIVQLGAREPWLAASRCERHE